MSAAVSSVATFSAFLGESFAPLPARREVPMPSDHEHDWSGRDESASLREGWFVQVGCYGARIRAVKVPAVFKNDAAAVAFVAMRAVKGDPLALRAVNYLAADHELIVPAPAGAPPDGLGGPILFGGVAGSDNDTSI
jgi:hypothetical protein